MIDLSIAKSIKCFTNVVRVRLKNESATICDGGAGKSKQTLFEMAGASQSVSVPILRLLQEPGDLD